jgi:hypothetical protein
MRRKIKKLGLRSGKISSIKEELVKRRFNTDCSAKKLLGKIVSSEYLILKKS